MPSRISKFRAYTKHLQRAFLALRQSYSHLERVLDDNLDIDWKSGTQSAGFITIRNMLWLSCIQEIAKLSNDAAGRTPSVRNIILSLEDTSLRDGLRERYVRFELSPDVCAALDKAKLTGMARDMFIMLAPGLRKREFDSDYEKLGSLRSSYRDSERFRCFVKIRDKRSAHIDIQYVDGEYVLLDIDGFGLKWVDLHEAMITLEQLVRIIGRLADQAPLPLDTDRKLYKESSEFRSRKT